MAWLENTLYNLWMSHNKFSLVISNLNIFNQIVINFPKLINKYESASLLGLVFRMISFSNTKRFFLKDSY